MNAPPHPETRRVEVRGLPIAVHGWGPGSAPPVVCLHGFMDHGRSFGFVAEALVPDFRVIAPDMRGHGESGWVGVGGYYHFYDYFSDVLAVLRAVGAPERPLYLLGHSMGGSVAAGVGALLGERMAGAVLLEGMGPPFANLADTPARLARWSEALVGPRTEGDAAARSHARAVLPSVEDAADRLVRVNPRLPLDRARHFARTFTEPHPRGTGWAWRYDPLHRTPAAKPFVEAEARALWRGLTGPVLSVYGEHGFRPPELAERHRAVPKLVAASIAGAGHNLHHERPELVASAVRWLAKGMKGPLPPGLIADR